MCAHRPNQASPVTQMNYPNHPTPSFRPARHRWRCRRCRMQLGSLAQGRLRVPFGELHGTGSCASLCTRCRTWNVIHVEPGGFRVETGLRATPPSFE